VTNEVPIVKYYSTRQKFVIFQPPMQFRGQNSIIK